MASPEVLDSSGLMDSVLSEELSGSAPGGWTKKLMPRKVGTPKRKDVVFISPEGEEFKTKKQLDKYLKTHPGGPPSADFDWSTGETPRRSARLNSKGRLSSDSTEAEPVSKRSRRSLDERSPGSSTTPTRRGRKSQAPVDENNKPAEDEIMQEALNEQDEGSAPATEVEAPEKEAEAEEVSKDEAAVVNESKEEVAAVAEGENQLSSSEEPQSIVVKVIAEETVLISEVVTAQADVTLGPDTAMKETESPVDEEKINATVIEAGVAELGDPLAADEVTKLPEGESLEETHDDVDAPQNLDEKPVVNSTTKDEDSLKPKDHVEPQGIHALIEEPVLCGDQ